MKTSLNPEEHQTIWEEIMRSPLDPDPEDKSATLRRLVPVIVASVVGLTLGYVLAGSAGGTDAGPELVAPASTTSTSPPPPPDPIFPPGYTATTEVGIKPLAAFIIDEDLFIVANSATRSDLDPVETNEFHIAEWILAGDGVENMASRAIQSDLAPGVRLVEFPGVASLPNSIPELLVREATEMVVRSGCNGCAATSVDMAEGEVSLGNPAIPYRHPEPLLVPVGNGINLSIDELHIAEEWGFAEWRVIDENDARVRVSLIVAFEGTDDPATVDTDPTALVPANRLGPNQQNPLAGSPGPFTRRGTQQLDRVGEILSEDNYPEGILLRWSVEWQHPVGDPVSLLIADIPDLGSFE
jgi:hypothetical protein